MRPSRATAQADPSSWDDAAYWAFADRMQDVLDEYWDGRLLLSQKGPGPPCDRCRGRGQAPFRIGGCEQGNGRRGPSRMSGRGRRSSSTCPLTARRVLDLGCATGATGKALKERQAAHVTGIEIEPEYAREAEATSTA